MTATLIFQGIFLWFTVAAVIAPFVGWVLHRSNARHLPRQINRDPETRMRGALR